VVGRLPAVGKRRLQDLGGSIGEERS
jgi:hypothetical protein